MSFIHYDVVVIIIVIAQALVLFIADRVDLSLNALQPWQFFFFHIKEHVV